MDKQFFTIRGHQKSGTNWLCHVLNLHPSIFCTGEFHFEFLFQGYDNFLKLECNKQFDTIVKHHVENIVKDCLLEKAKDSTKKEILCYGDRTPYDLFPEYIQGMKQFLIIRDGRDVAISHFYHALRIAKFEGESHGKTIEMSQKYSDFLKKATLFKQDPDYFLKNPNQLLDDEFIIQSAKIWNIHVKMNLPYAEKNKDNIYVVLYENLHQNIEKERRKLYSFLGLNPELAAPLDANTKPGFPRTDNLTFNRKGQYNEWMIYFNKDQHLLFNKYAGESLSKLNYEMP